MSTKNFDVVAERDGKWWVFDIPELGTGGQAHSLGDVEFEAQGVAAMWLDIDPETVNVHVSVRGTELKSALTQWEKARRIEDEAREAQKQAAAMRRDIVIHLRQQQYSAQDVGKLLGITRQRVYQLENA